MPRNYKVEVILWVLFVLLSTACQPQRVSDTFYFAWYYVGDKIPSSYQIRKVDQDGNDRKETIEFYDYQMNLTETDVENYFVNALGLDKKVGSESKPYLSTQNTECITYSYSDKLINDIFKTEICYLGKEDVTIGSKTLKNAHKFKKTLGEFHRVESVMYLDANFVLLKEEYVSGYTYAYKIVRLDSALKL